MGWGVEWYSNPMRELASLWRHREVLVSLARHELRKSSAGTAAGIAWAVLTPIIPLLIFTAVFSFGLRLPLGGAPYVYGFAAAYVPWVLISTSITGAAGSILEHRFLVKRVVFPVEIIPANPLLVQTVPHVVLLAVTATACFVAGYARVPELFLILYFYVCAAVLTISAGLFLSGLTVIVRDVQQVLPSFVNVWFWVTPVAWAAASLPPRGRTLLALNPAAYVVSGYRYALMPGIFPPPAVTETIAFWVVAAAMLFTGSMFFRHTRPHLWDCL